MGRHCSFGSHQKLKCLSGWICLNNDADKRTNTDPLRLPALTTLYKESLIHRFASKSTPALVVSLRKLVFTFFPPFSTVKLINSLLFWMKLKFIIQSYLFIHHLICILSFILALREFPVKFFKLLINFMQHFLLIISKIFPYSEYLFFFNYLVL